MPPKSSSVLSWPLWRSRQRAPRDGYGLRNLLALDGGSDLLGAGRHGEHALRLDAMVKRVLCNRCSTAHVLVGRVGAGANQANLQLLRPLVRFDRLLELADRGREIGREGAVDVRFEFGQVDLNELVVLGALVLAKFGSVRASEVADLLALGRLRIVRVSSTSAGQRRRESVPRPTRTETGWPPVRCPLSTRHGPSRVLQEFTDLKIIVHPVVEWK